MAASASGGAGADAEEVDPVGRFPDDDFAAVEDFAVEDFVVEVEPFAAKPSEGDPFAVDSFEGEPGVVVAAFVVVESFADVELFADAEPAAVGSSAVGSSAAGEPFAADPVAVVASGAGIGVIVGAGAGDTLGAPEVCSAGAAAGVDGEAPLPRLSLSIQPPAAASPRSTSRMNAIRPQRRPLAGRSSSDSLGIGALVRGRWCAAASGTPVAARGGWLPCAAGATVTGGMVAGGLLGGTGPGIEGGSVEYCCMPGAGLCTDGRCGGDEGGVVGYAASSAILCVGATWLWPTRAPQPPQNRESGAFSVPQLRQGIPP